MKTIFLNASDSGYDAKVAKVFYDGFKSHGVDIYYAPVDFLPGQNIEKTLKEEIFKRDFFLNLMSEVSIKEGRHIGNTRKAISRMDEMVPGSIFILPVWSGDPNNYEKNKYATMTDNLKAFTLFPDWENTIETIFKIVGVSKPSRIEIPNR